MIFSLRQGSKAIYSHNTSERNYSLLSAQAKIEGIRDAGALSAYSDERDRELGRQIKEIHRHL